MHYEIVSHNRKGLSYLEYRPGFGKDNVEKMIVTLSNYANYYDTENFYRTAICTLHEYVKKNKRYGDINDELEKQIKNLLGQPNTSSEEQENNVRKILNMDDAEILILFIGIGNYPEICQTTKSERKAIEITEI